MNKQNITYLTVGFLMGIFVGTMIKNPKQADELAATFFRELI